MLGGTGSKSKGEISYMLMVMERRRNGSDWFAQEIESSHPGRQREDAAQTWLGSGLLPLQLKAWWCGSEAGDGEFWK